jgi:hypothetical protein
LTRMAVYAKRYDNESGVALLNQLNIDNPVTCPYIETVNLSYNLNMG